MNKVIGVDVAEFDYYLPEERIAKFPLDDRDFSKLLVFNDGIIKHFKFNEIVNILKSSDLLVFNNTKVVQARLNFSKVTGAKIEIFILEPHNPSDYAVSFASSKSCIWKCIIGNLKRWKGEVLEMSIPNQNSTLKAQMIDSEGEGVLVEFNWDNPELSFANVIEHCGNVPIPPYLNRMAIDNDRITYQTVYAKPEGSVAAPTAGLHFTPSLIKQIAEKGVDLEFVTLHVGAGTFKPVKANTIIDHEMHTEHFFVNDSVIDKLRRNTGNVVSVGTTTLRTLESVYWLGVKIKYNLFDPNSPFIGQWEPYNLHQDTSLAESLEVIGKWLKTSKKGHIEATTQLCIIPGYHFKVVDRLITNYHQPRSTLLMLVAAFIGENWKTVYKYAMDNDFRFLSYGDSSLLYKSQ